MKNNDEEILKSFKKAEKQFFSAVKQMPKIDESANGSDLKTNIEQYINQIGKLKEMLSDYEESVMIISKNNSKQAGKTSKTDISLKKR